MTKARRLTTLLALVAAAAIVSSYTLGQSSSKKGAAGSTVTPQLTSTPASAPAKADVILVPDRFTAGGVLSYQPVHGDTLFALQLKPQLPQATRRPRDYVILISTSAAMAGPGWIAAHQLAEGIANDAEERDQLAILLVGDKETRDFTHGFLAPKDDQHKKQLAKYMKVLKEKEYASGADNLKKGLNEAIAAFASKAGRQRVLVYMGNGQSVLDPISANDRQALADKMIAKQVACFTVPLGRGLSHDILHGLPTSTGGVVLRTAVEEEKLDEALKRFEQAFAGTILYASKLQLPAEVIATEVYPAVLPPLRADAGTLVVGKMKPASNFTYTVTGTIAGRDDDVKITVADKLQPGDLENFFLVGLVQQWRRAKDRPATLRSDRALTLSYENARLKYKDMLLSAQVAIERNQFDAADRIYHDIQNLAPDDSEAIAGIKILDKLKKGTLTTDMLKSAIEKGGHKGDRVGTDKGTGKVSWGKGDLVMVAQLDEKDKKGADKGPGGVGEPGGGAGGPARKPICCRPIATRCSSRSRR